MRIFWNCRTAIAAGAPASWQNLQLLTPSWIQHYMHLLGALSEQPRTQAHSLQRLLDTLTYTRDTLAKTAHPEATWYKGTEYKKHAGFRAQGC